MHIDIQICKIQLEALNIELIDGILLVVLVRHSLITLQHGWGCVGKADQRIGVFLQTSVNIQIDEIYIPNIHVAPVIGIHDVRHGAIIEEQHSEILYKVA